MSDNQKWSILQGDALKVLGTFAPNTFDAVITDPPYASGGRTQAEKTNPPPGSIPAWARTHRPLSMGTPRTSAPGPAGRQSGCMKRERYARAVRRYVCLSTGGSFPRRQTLSSGRAGSGAAPLSGIKGNSRPQKGRFRQQAEYIVWGSNGDMPISRPVPCLPGVFKYGNPQSRIHLTEKPLQLMRDIVKITEPGGHILDPFAGSGTTVLAAVQEGYTATGIEVTDTYAELARERIRAELEKGGMIY